MSVRRFDFSRATTAKPRVQFQVSLNRLLLILYNWETDSCGKKYTKSLVESHFYVLRQIRCEENLTLAQQVLKVR